MRNSLGQSLVCLGIYNVPTQTLIPLVGELAKETMKLYTLYQDCNDIKAS